jgi:DHA1 family bicyclomycin/chloramphenicol resistance-like MFS transporter
MQSTVTGRKKMRTAEFIALSAATMMLTALGIDIMLPVFGELRKAFGLPRDSTATAQIIGFFFMGQIAQIFFGTLSDRYGRLAILRIGFPLYILGGVAAAFAPTLMTMCIARFIAGVGASAVLTTTIAGVRDRFAGDEMARIMSLVFTIFLFTPVIAPFLGIAILLVSSWQMVFLTPPIFAVVVFLWSLRLEESLPRETRISLNWKGIGKGIRSVVSNRIFLRYTMLTTLLFIGLSSYVASSEHIVGEIYGRPELFAWIFAGIGFVMAVFTLINSRLSATYGARRSLKFLLILYCLVATLLVVYSFSSASQPGITLLFTAIGLLLALNLAIEPNSSALALEPLGKFAGIASSVYGTFFFFLGSSLGSVISGLMQKSVLPLVLTFFIVGILALILAIGDRRPVDIPE